MPSRVCHLFAQCSIKASTSDWASASLSDSAFRRLLKSKTNGAVCPLKCAIHSWHCFHHAWTSLIAAPRYGFSSYGFVWFFLAALSNSRASSSSLDFPVGALVYIRSASTRHRSLTSIHRCLACSLRRSLLKTCAETSSVRVPRVVKYIVGIPYLPSDPVDTQARGIGNMVAFWERMRNICPKVNTYNGPILKESGAQCLTSQDLDEAMLSTRKFWFERPVEQDERWADILQVYRTSEMWPDVPLPNKKDLLHTLLHTKDSAPGPDGLPYSAWRLLPEVTVDAMTSYFMDIMENTALPPMQVGVWIPKAKMGPEADNFRPLGMPNTLDRLVDGTIASVVMRAVSSNMHPSQTVMSMFKEPARAVTAIQSFLDSSIGILCLARWPLQGLWTCQSLLDSCTA